MPPIQCPASCEKSQPLSNEKNRFKWKNWRRRIPQTHKIYEKNILLLISCQLNFWVFHIERTLFTYCMPLQIQRIDIPSVFLLAHVDSYCRLLRHRSYRYSIEVELRRQFGKVWDVLPLSRQTMSLHYEERSFKMKSSR